MLLWLKVKIKILSYICLSSMDLFSPWQVHVRVFKPAQAGSVVSFILSYQSYGSEFYVVTPMFSVLGM